jgi:Flp pilus assembly protein TadB
MGRTTDRPEEVDMELDEITGHDWTEGESSDEVARPDVVIRIVYSLLFAIVVSILEWLVFAIVAFQLLFSLVTQRLPSRRLQTFANQLVAYFRQILRYLTHNDSVIPFPFSDLPEPLEPCQPAYEPADPGDDASEL